ncbi:lipopolysaccharide biosynthesis protein [Lactiplantibacillus plantarum]|uniref:lipopolysaccharide biosynthesis protein n=1 Tax=Lactiplantibacillus plantarum TaxID=1590 RepID=UPI0006CB0AAF|nr:oligosaccharide flippase family protein [Lactiplantibacillus plantarum]ALF13831.1 hypothetical protein AKJ11_01390 [Lactiplantibacillus plantarum]QKX10193.1 hypothetical protein Heal19_501587 [Lactiplantibacillus plantarum]WOI05206.1 oligosaccharide flippase family protein [Lactiplantibacillus plantarum]
MRNRTASSVQNILYSVIGQTVGLLLSFILRIIFVRMLNSSYLGVDSLFTSLVTVLSLAELGVGSAINFSLYKPLSDKNTEKIKSLMGLYRRAYIFIGCVVFIIGLCMIPFIQKISNVHSQVPNLRFLFFLFVVNSSISYFYSYKKSLIIADQYRYITVIYTYVSFALMCIAQGIALIIFKQYVLYLIIMILSTLFQNILISKKADKMYPYLKDKNIKPVDKGTQHLIVRNAYAMSLHKIGGVIVNSTDSVIISAFVGIKQVGKYSNYLLVTNALNLVFSQIFTAIIASVGNLGAELDKKHVREVFNTVFFAGYWLVSFCSCCLFVLFNPFIKIWIGSSYVFSTWIVTVIVLNFYIYQIRRPVLTFRDALGIYWFDRYIPVIESILNLTISIILTRKIGISGALLGTIISSLLTNVWIEPLMLYRHGLKTNTLQYYLKFIIYMAIAAINILIVDFFVQYLVRGINNTALAFILMMILTIILFNLFFVFFFLKTKDFRAVKTLLIGILNSLKEKVRGE